jgi:hypothetical protein
MKAGWVAALVLGALVASAPVAQANAVYSFNGDGLTALITTSSTLNAMGGYDVLDITGTLAGHGAITSLLTNPDQPNNYTFTGVGGGTNFTFDNVFYTDAQHIDDNGIVFQVADGNYVDLWGNGANDYEVFVGNYVSDTRGAAAIEAVPEPSAIAMLLTGIVALFGFAAFRRKDRLVPVRA